MINDDDNDDVLDVKMMQDDLGIIIYSRMWKQWT